jgi:N-methylhydantoinase B
MKNGKEEIMLDDPVTFEVVRSGLYSICEEMKVVMTRASFSPLLSLSADLSCALLDAEGAVVAQGRDIPVHLGAMPFAAAGILAVYPPDTWQPGDAVLSNDPYSGGSHLPDMTMLTGIFSDNILIGFAASRVHWPDIGGSVPGSSAVTDEIIKEGLRIPPVKIVRDGKLDPDLGRILFANVRVPGDRLGDFQAQIAGNARGVGRVQALAARYGRDRITRIFAETQRYSEHLIRKMLEAIPDGSYHAAHHLDGDGFVEDRGNGDLVISVTITKKGTSIHCDFTGTGKQTKGPVNAPRSVSASACYYTVLALAGGSVPPNSGAYRPLTVTTPEGTLVNPRYPAPVVAANTEASNRIVDVLLDALSQAVPDKAIGGSYGCGGVWAIGGWDPGRAKRFVHLETTGGGMGASSKQSGLNGHRVHMGNTMNLPIEAIEAVLPIRMLEYSLAKDSGGKGVHRGGAGVRRAFECLASDIEFSLLFERSIHPAQGAKGGSSGMPAKFSVTTKDGKVSNLGSKTVTGRLEKGDVLFMQTAGGGGWGAA